MPSFFGAFDLEEGVPDVEGPADGEAFDQELFLAVAEQPHLGDAAGDAAGEDLEAAEGEAGVPGPDRGADLGVALKMLQTLLVAWRSRLTAGASMGWTRAAISLPRQ